MSYLIVFVLGFIVGKVSSLHWLDHIESDDMYWEE